MSLLLLDLSQPPQCGGAVRNPVWVETKWLLVFPKVSVTPTISLEEVDRSVGYLRGKKNRVSVSRKQCLAIRNLMETREVVAYKAETNRSKKVNVEVTPMLRDRHYN